MRVVIDIEANGLHNPTQVWVIVCKDIDTGVYHVFRNVTTDEQEKQRFLLFARGVSLWIGHHILGYDLPVLVSLLGIGMPDPYIAVVDTLVISKMVDYPRDGHSIEDYGIEFNLPKGDFSDWSKYSKAMEEYCVRDVDIAHKIYTKYLRYINNHLHKPAIGMEQDFQLKVNELHDNGFAFNTKKASNLLDKVKGELDELDENIRRAFPDRLRPIREITPKLTGHGTLNKSDFRFVKGGDLSIYNGGPFTRCEWVSFNPSSHKQIVDTLHGAGWSPFDKTKTHVETERKINRLKRSKQSTSEVDISLKAMYDKILGLQKYGWKINELNLSTLPASAPKAARILAKRILLESRRRTLVEWLGLVRPGTERIHGSFYGIGAWTHRMAHQQPNTANITNEYNGIGKPVLYGKEMRSCWRAGFNRLLVGVDAKNIQLRIFAHYIDDEEFTRELVNGDAHSLNQRILGPVCKNRASAKRFIFALLLGAGPGKLAEILECSSQQAESALGCLMERYQGFNKLKKEVIPTDAKRGWFAGIDGRPVRIPGETLSERKHLCMSGYLQNGETVVMKAATCRWVPKMKLLYPTAKLVDLVHDEWQTETENNLEEAIRLAEIQSQSLREVGEIYKLKCPLIGSYGEPDKEGKMKYTIGQNWSLTH